LKSVVHLAETGTGRHVFTDALWELQNTEWHMSRKHSIFCHKGFTLQYCMRITNSISNMNKKTNHSYSGADNDE